MVWLPELLFSSFKCLESALSSRVTTPGVHIRWLCASCLHGFTFSLGFSSLRYPVLIVYSSHSPHRVVPFGCILARTPRWFDRYSSLTLISWVTFGDIESVDPWCNLRGVLRRAFLLGLGPLCSSVGLSEFLFY